jgi:hypothetical protein
MMKMHITSTQAYILTLASLLCGMVFTTWYPAAPYGVFAPTVSVIFGAYITKRLIQKEAKFGGGSENGSEVEK